MRVINVFILILLSNIIIAQTNIDSLEALIPQKSGIEKVDLINQISFSYWNISPAKGIEHAENAKQISIDIGYRDGEARALLNQGVSHWAKGTFDMAITCSFNALDIYKETNNKKGESSCYNNIGIAYLSTNKHEEAIEYFKKSKELAIELGRFQTIIDNNNNIGNTYITLEKYDDALSYFYENIEINETNHLNHNISPSLSNIGTCLMELGRAEEAISYIKQAYSFELETSQKYYAAMSANQIGSYYLKKEDTVKAFKYLTEAEKLAIEAEAMEPLQTIQGDLATYYTKTNELRKALSYKDKYIATSDSLYNERSSQQIAEMKTQFESEQKEKENDLLRKGNRIQELEIEKQISLKNYFFATSILIFILVLILFNRFRIKRKANLILSLKNKIILEQKEELKTINEELTKQYNQLNILNITKDKFFKIISHDLKGPFNSILGVTGMLIEDYHNFDDAEKISFLKSLNQSSQDTYSLLGNLLMWAQSQTGEIKICKEPLKLKEFIETTIGPYKLNASRKNIDIQNQIPSDLTASLDKNTSTTFIGNLVNNAIKFTRKDGHISINASRDKEKTIICIADNGVGMTTEAIKKLFQIDKNISTVGTNNEKGTGLGLILCKEFIEMNGGQLTVKSKVDIGSEFILTFPQKA